MAEGVVAVQAVDVDISPGMLKGHFTRLNLIAEAQLEDNGLARARQRDTAMHGLKVVESVSAKELLVSDDASEFARTNAAVRIPTTLDHPGNPSGG